MARRLIADGGNETFGLEVQTPDGKWVDQIERRADRLYAPDGTRIDTLRIVYAPTPTDRCNGYTASSSAFCGLSDGWGRDPEETQNPGRCDYHRDQPYRGDYSE